MGESVAVDGDLDASILGSIVIIRKKNKKEGHEYYEDEKKSIEHIESIRKDMNKLYEKKDCLSEKSNDYEKFQNLQKEITSKFTCIEFCLYRNGEFHASAPWAPR